MQIKKALIGAHDDYFSMPNLSPQDALRAYNKGADYATRAKGAGFFQSRKRTHWNAPLTPVRNFTTQVDASLPRLAWLCEIDGSDYRFSLGSAVEYGDNYVVEGVWDAPFMEVGFHSSDHFYGSGATLIDGVCVFSPPRHCTDYLYILRDEKRRLTLVSNSFNFAFKRLNLDLSGEFFRIFKTALNRGTNSESALGADRGSPVIAIIDGLAAFRLTYHNFTIGENGALNILARLPSPVPFATFPDYRKFLLRQTTALIANGSDPARKNPLGTISTISTGYDSCAVSAICAKVGVKDTITLDVITGGHDDSGEKIAAALGMICHKARSPLGTIVPGLKVSISNVPDAFLEFFATAGVGDNLAFLDMEPHLRDKIVFSGLYGDGVWGTGGIGSGLPHGLPYMKSRNEFRLRVGYALVPTPAFGAYFPWWIEKLANEPETCKYALGGSYDRPIPRRLAEEAGVPRELFGQRKAANNPEIINWKDFFDVAVTNVMTRYR